MGRYKVLTAEFADLLLGYYGEAPGERDKDLIEQAKKQTGKEPITERPADLLEPEWDNLVEEADKLDGTDGSDEDVLTNALFPQVAPGFFKASGDATAIREPITYKVTTGGRSHTVSVEPA